MTSRRITAAVGPAVVVVVFVGVVVGPPPSPQPVASRERIKRITKFLIATSPSPPHREHTAL
jgi:hypothetical protein